MTEHPKIEAAAEEVLKETKANKWFYPLLILSVTAVVVLAAVFIAINY